MQLSFFLTHSRTQERPLEEVTFALRSNREWEELLDQGAASAKALRWAVQSLVEQRDQQELER